MPSVAAGIPEQDPAGLTGLEASAACAQPPGSAGADDGEAAAGDANAEEAQGEAVACDHGEEDEDEEAEGDADVTEIEPAGLGHAQALFGKGCDSIRAGDFNEAADFFSRSLEIRARHFGDLAIECAPTYYKYGMALLYKAQGESDALNEPAPLNDQVESQPSEGTDQPKNDTEEEDLEEEESDLDAAWKMLDIARAIYEKQQSHSIQEVDVITALADVSLEREDFEMCFRDYTRALELLEGIVEPDSRRIAELCFKLSLAHQLGYGPKEALRYCQQAVSVCEKRLERLRSEGAVTNGNMDSRSKHILDGAFKASGEDAQGGSEPGIAMQASSEQEEEIKEIEQLLEDLREKVVELQEMAAGPSLLEALKATNPVAVSTIQQVFSATAAVALQNADNGSSSGAAVSIGFDAPTASTAPTVIDLGVVGRGVKRATPVCVTGGTNESNVPKKRSLDDMMTKGGAGDTQIGFGACFQAGNISSNN